MNPRRHAVVVIVLGALASYVGLALPVFRSGLQEYYGINLTQLGLLFSIGLAPAAAGTLVAGLLLDRRDPLPLIRVGLAGTAVGFLVAAAAGRFAVMLAAVLWVSPFVGLLGVAVPTYVVRIFADRQRRALSLQLAVWSAVGIVFPLIAEALLHLEETLPGLGFARLFHAPFVVLAAVLFAGAIWIGRVPVPPVQPAADDSNPTRGRSRELRFGGLSAPTVGLMVLLAVHASSDTALAIWLPRTLDSGSFPARGLAPGVVLAGAALAYLVSRTLLGLVPEHRGRRLGMMAPGPLGGGLVLAGLMTHNATGLGLCYVAGAFLWSCEYPILLAAAAREAPGQFGAVMGLSSVGGSVGALLLGLAMGWAGEALGEDRLWMVLAAPACGFVLVGLGGALWLLLHGRLNRSHG